MSIPGWAFRPCRLEPDRANPIFKLQTWGYRDSRPKTFSLIFNEARSGWKTEPDHNPDNLEFSYYDHYVFEKKVLRKMYLDRRSLRSWERSFEKKCILNFTLDDIDIISVCLPCFHKQDLLPYFFTREISVSQKKSEKTQEWNILPLCGTKFVN